MINLLLPWVALLLVNLAHLSLSDIKSVKIIFLSRVVRSTRQMCRRTHEYYSIADKRIKIIVDAQFQVTLISAVIYVQLCIFVEVWAVMAYIGGKSNNCPRIFIRYRLRDPDRRFVGRVYTEFIQRLLLCTIKYIRRHVTAQKYLGRSVGKLSCLTTVSIRLDLWTTSNRRMP